MINKKIKDTATEAARKAGQILLKEYQKFDRSKVSFKSKHEILTAADVAAEKEIIKTIRKSFPEHQILAEESGETKSKSDYKWFIDPLDGTTNFSMHNPLWATSIGLSYKNKVVLAVIYSPTLNEFFYAEKDKGAYLNNKKIKVSKFSGEKVINTFCHGSQKKHIKKAIRYYNKQKLAQFDARQLGSASMELAYVASARVESITIPGANSWDVVAGALLVKEAGGKVTDFNNKTWNLNSYDIIASNGKVHKQILDALN
ncbi:MAG TPA: inositol monophosphatase family protein [Patescibacteria group bacterium]|nr:inositol monophosphatase family protein [Patescibacteria group bacterium]